MHKNYFGFFEMIGSIVLLILDPNNRNNKKYLDNRYLKTNRRIGILAMIILISIGMYWVLT